MRLSSLSRLPPFFSPTYLVSDTLFLARGEDTLIGLEAGRRGLQCMDIDTLIFHDTFDISPSRGSEDDREIQLRLYYACTGWLGRKPFYELAERPGCGKREDVQNSRWNTALPLCSGTRRIPFFWSCRGISAQPTTVCLK
jgi:hypothetical protein